MVVQALKRLAFRQGFTIARHVAVADQARLFDMMKPVKTDIDLIRIGGDDDGGYLVPDDLEGLVACYSPGVSTTATFEEDMVRRGVPCFLADASVPNAPIEHPLIQFEPKFLGTYSAEGMTTLDDWMDAKTPGVTSDLILQMDIETAEWPVLLNASDTALAAFRIMVIEFHWGERIFDPFGHQVIAGVFERLTRLFDIVHIHPNNYMPIVDAGSYAIPYAFEATFLRKGRATVRGHATQFPHPLDRDCAPHMKPIVLPDCMHG